MVAILSQPQCVKLYFTPSWAGVIITRPSQSQLDHMVGVSDSSFITDISSKIFSTEYPISSAYNEFYSNHYEKHKLKQDQRYLMIHKNVQQRKISCWQSIIFLADQTLLWMIWLWITYFVQLMKCVWINSKNFIKNFICVEFHKGSDTTFILFK